MSKASAWVARQEERPEKMVRAPLNNVGGARSGFIKVEVTPEGRCGFLFVWKGNYGGAELDAAEACDLARWVLDMFSETSA